MEMNDNQKKPDTERDTTYLGKLGGARPGAGRKPGSTNKLSGQAILESIEKTVGIPYADQLAANYLDTIINNDTALRHQYDKLFLSKVVADKVEVDLTSTEDLVAVKAQAFADALAAIQTHQTTKSDGNK